MKAWVGTQCTHVACPTVCPATGASCQKECLSLIHPKVPPGPAAALLPGCSPEFCPQVASLGRPSLRAAWSLHLLQQHLSTCLSCSRTRICSHFCAFLYILEVTLLLFTPSPTPRTQQVRRRDARHGRAGGLRGAGVSLRQQQGTVSRGRVERLSAEGAK